MENFFKSFFTGDNQKPSKLIIESLTASFPNAVNIEWNLVKNEWEALFYSLDMECIVRFSKKGQLIESRKNYPLDVLDSELKKVLSKHGELMNAIEINKEGAGVFFECIFRDKDLNRFMMLVDDQGLIKDRVNL